MGKPKKEDVSQIEFKNLCFLLMARDFTCISQPTSNIQIFKKGKRLTVKVILEDE